jgi:hypothetical protein
MCLLSGRQDRSSQAAGLKNHTGGKKTTGGRVSFTKKVSGTLWHAPARRQIEDFM